MYPTIQIPRVKTGPFVFGVGTGRASLLPVPESWQQWLMTLFPTTFTADFADRHVQLWQWIDTIEADSKPTPSAYIDVEPRGGGKTTTAETAVIRLGAKEARKFVLYVRGTQDKANESIQNIAAKLESRSISQRYPRLANRSLTKYGHSRGWRVDMLRCGNGFNVVGLGLDAAVRGVKLDDYRPDFIIFDDIDNEHDSPKTVQKKSDIITKSILPAGASHAAYLVIQNLIHGAGLVAQLVEGTADFLHDRIMSGPHKAVNDLVYEPKPGGGYRIVAGTETWAGQSLEICQQQINEWGLSAFLREAQHEVDESGGLWDHIVFQHIERANLPAFERGAVWVDPAVTSTDDSDCMAIAAGGMASGKLYVTYAWERVTSPEDVLQRAIHTAARYGFETVGVETDQGGDTWESVFNRVIERMLQTDELLPQHKPKFKQAKAGAGHGSKVHRNGQMMVDYEHGNVYHVIGPNIVIEKSLKRFPKKPLDLADAMYWLWNDMLGKKQSKMGAKRYA